MVEPSEGALDPSENLGTPAVASQGKDDSAKPIEALGNGAESSENGAAEYVNKLFQTTKKRPAPTSEPAAQEPAMPSATLDSVGGTKSTTTKLPVGTVATKDANAPAATKVEAQPRPKKKSRRAMKTSRFRGVCWDKHHRKWKARCAIAGRTISIGYYSDEEDAARAYDRVAMRAAHKRCTTNNSIGLLPSRPEDKERTMPSRGGHSHPNGLPHGLYSGRGYPPTVAEVMDSKVARAGMRSMNHMHYAHPSGVMSRQYGHSSHVGQGAYQEQQMMDSMYRKGMERGLQVMAEMYPYPPDMRGARMPLGKGRVVYPRHSEGRWAEERLPHLPGRHPHFSNGGTQQAGIQHVAQALPWRGAPPAEYCSSSRNVWTPQLSQQPRMPVGQTEQQRSVNLGSRGNQQPMQPGPPALAAISASVKNNHNGVPPSHQQQPPPQGGAV